MTERELARSLRLPQATALVAGTIIGASIFVQASEITSLVPSIPVILLAWLRQACSRSSARSCVRS